MKKTILAINNFDEFIFEILFNQKFSIEMFNVEEIILLVKVIEQIDLSVLNEVDDENEQNYR